MADASMPAAADRDKVAENRRQAIALGLKLYHGRPCRTHGTTVRRLSSGECPTCVTERAAAWCAENKERRAAKKVEWNEKNAEKMRDCYRQYHEVHRKEKNKLSRDWHHANRERAIARGSTWQKANPEKRREIRRRYYENNRDKVIAYNERWRKANPEKSLETTKRWQRANPEKVTATGAVRRARKRLVVPPWLSREHRAEIVKLFARARREGVSVDHIIPIAGCRVCGAQGLHVPWNMRLIPDAENSSKGNRCQECWFEEKNQSS